MASLESAIQQALTALYKEPVPLTPATIRGLVEERGGGGSKREIAAGNKALAAELGVNVRTVQRWQKAPGESRTKAGASSEARNPARSKQAPELQRRAAQQHIRTQGVDVDPCETEVHVYDEPRSRPRTVAGPGRSALHIDGDVMGTVLDALDKGRTVEAADAFGDAWLHAYATDMPDAEITNVSGQLQFGY